jgi:hypothetical protein
MKTYSGCPDVPFTSLVRDTITVHGLQFAMRYYSRKISGLQLRVIMRSAYLGA